jgi:hypothetical protein
MISGIGARNPVLLIRKRRCVGIERFDAGEINDTQPVKLPDILISLRQFKDRGRGTRVADQNCENFFRC